MDTQLGLQILAGVVLAVSVAAVIDLLSIRGWMARVATAGVTESTPVDQLLPEKAARYGAVVDRSAALGAVCAVLAMASGIYLAITLPGFGYVWLAGCAPVILHSVYRSARPHPGR